MLKTTLSDRERVRYSRQLLLPGFGFDGQERLRAAQVLMIGVGGLGCAAAQYLVAAGVGTLVVVDGDNVELSNLQRQILYRDADLGRAKAEVAAAALAALNPQVAIAAVVARLDDGALAARIAQADLVLDCSDNLATRQQLNRLCHNAAKPLVMGAAIRVEGQVLVLPMTAGLPCYQCFSHHFGETQLSCVEAGVLAPLVGVVGAVQALEAVKLLTGLGTIPTGELALFDGAHSDWRRFRLVRWRDCPVCGREEPE